MEAKVKKIAFLVPRTGMADAAFRQYWRQIHGPLVAGSPGYAAWRLRYVQNHVVGDGPVGGAFAFAGMAEFWLPGEAPNEDAFSSSPVYRDRIRIDELNFIDMSRTVSFAAREQVIAPGRGKVKVVVLSRRGSTLPEDAFRSGLAAAARRLVDAGLAGGLRGWRADHVIAGSFRLPGAAPTVPLGVDCMQSLWFDSKADMASFFAAVAASGASILDRPDVVSFLAEELVFFDVLDDAA